MRFLVTGASGFIGKRFLLRLRSLYGRQNVVGTYYSHEMPGLVMLDMTDATQARDLVTRQRPDIVVHCSALPGVNFCEQEQEKARLLNVGGTVNITDACRAAKAKLVFLSTNFLFDGKKGGYIEADEASPLNNYGMQKLEAKQYIQKALSHYLILRTTNVFGFDPLSKNFVMTTIEALRQGKTLAVAADQYGNPTHVDDLVEIAIRLIRLGKDGVFNAVGPDCCNRLEFALSIAREFGFPEALVTGKPTEELHEAATRPKNACLDISKIVKETGFMPMGLAAGLAHMRKEMEASHGTA